MTEKNLKHYQLQATRTGRFSSKEPNFSSLPKGAGKASFIGIDYAALESKMVYSWSNGDGTFTHHSECKDEACDICKPGLQGFDVYSYLAKKHNLSRHDVKTNCYWIFYTVQGFNPQTKKEMVEGIEKHMGIFKC